MAAPPTVKRHQSKLDIKYAGNTMILLVLMRCCFDFRTTAIIERVAQCPRREGRGTTCIFALGVLC
jgi:hypothetical protein